VFAAIVAATFKTHSEQKSAGVRIDINSTLTNDADVFWENVRSFHSYANHFVDNGLYAYFELMTLRLHIQLIVGVGKTAADMDALVQPLLAELDAKAVPYTTATAEFATLYELYLGLFEDEGAGSSALTGGWMFPRADVAANNDGIIEAFKTVVDPHPDLAGQGFIVGHLWDAGHSVPVPNSATNPRFRSSSDFSIVGLVVSVGST
jgi:hypothetical protein